MEKKDNIKNPSKTILKIILWSFNVVIIVCMIIDFSRANNENQARDLMVKGNYQQALDIYNALPGGAKSTSALSGRADCYYVLGQYQNAIEDYDRLSGVMPKHASIYSDRGDCRFKLLQYDAALADYDKAISLNPKMARAYAGRSNCYKKAGKDDLAEKDKNTAMTLGYKPE